MNFLIKGLACLAAAAGASDKVWIDEKQVVRDAEGRQLLLHGVNIVYKVAPYIPETDVFTPETSLTDEDIADLKGWGFNFVRLGVLWEAVETAPGVYNETFLGEVETLINKLGDAGIYTLVDAHQDAISRMTCGEGMPDFYAREVAAQGAYCIGKYSDWILDPLLKRFAGLCNTMKDFNYPQNANGDPEVESCLSKPFFNYYLTTESWSMFRALYDNHLGMQDKYLAFWEKVANTFSSNPYVLGYDPINEPMPAFGSVLDVVNKLWPGHYDREQLAPLYSKIYAKYMNANTENIMAFEPGQFPDSLPKDVPVIGGDVFNVGFEKPPGAEIGSVNHILNDHTYCC